MKIRLYLSFCLILFIFDQFGRSKAQDFFNYERIFKTFAGNTNKDDSHMLHHLIESYLNESFADVEKVLKNNLNSIHPQCMTDAMAVIGGIPKKRIWSTLMLDALGKPGSNIFYGNVHWVGNQDECLSVDAPGSETGSPGGFKGQYCSATTDVKPNPLLPLPVVIGICVPNSCDTEDSTQLFALGVDALWGYLKLNTTKPKVTTMACNKPWGTVPLTTSAIAMICVLSCFVFVIICATMYEWLLSWAPQLEFGGPKKRKQSLNNINRRDSRGRHRRTLNPDGRVSPSAYAIHSDEDEETSGDEEEGRRKSDESSSRTSGGEEVRTILHNGSAIGAPLAGTDVIGNSTTQLVAVPDKQPSFQQPRSLWSRLLLSFSLITNVSKIFDTSAPAEGTLSCVHGIRVFSLWWVILGHSYVFSVSINNNIGSFYIQRMKEWTFQAIMSATVSVDSFFVLSGLLTAYLFYRKVLNKHNPFMSGSLWLYFFLHRYWRLTPPYMLFMGTYVALFTYLWSSPLWPQEVGIDPNCEKYWWTNLLYINNLVHTNKMCMGWSWYLANDMQFYILSPLLMVPFYYSAVAGGILHVLVLVGSMIATGVISAHNHLSVSIVATGPANSFDLIYIKPWCRIGPYVIGMATGYLLARTNCRARLNKLIVVVGWLLATALALTAVYCLSKVSHDQTQLTNDVSALYNSTFRIAWALALAWVIFACCSGYGGWVNKLLSWSALFPISRLTYAAYLVHPMVIYFVYLGQSQGIVFNNIVVVTYYLAFLVMSYGVAFIVSVTFESPLLGLEKAFFRR